MILHHAFLEHLHVNSSALGLLLKWLPQQTVIRRLMWQVGGQAENHRSSRSCKVSLSPWFFQFGVWSPMVAPWTCFLNRGPWPVSVRPHVDQNNSLLVFSILGFLWGCQLSKHWSSPTLPLYGEGKWDPEISLSDSPNITQLVLTAKIRPRASWLSSLFCCHDNRL